MVHPYSHRVPRVRRYSGFSFAAVLFRIRDSHPLSLTFPCHSARFLQCFLAVLTPDVFLLLVWPFPLSLATTCGISVDFFSSPYLDVSVQAVSLIYLCIQYMMYGLLHTDFSIRKSAAQWIFAPPRGFSQLITSFFGSQCQGIPLAPFVA